MQQKFILYTKKLFFCLIFALCVVSIFAQKTKKDARKQPEWVTNRPISNEYYIGISAAIKKGFLVAEYTAKAQQNASSDLAASISIKIESNSALKVIQSNTSEEQRFISEIKSSLQLELEGYEIVDTWEDGEYYWVYYRLSKQKYARLKELKKQQAIEAAYSNYLQAEKWKKEKLFTNAISEYAKALSILENYLGESTHIIIEGKKVDIATECFSQITDIIRNTKIVPPLQRMDFIRGVEIAPEMLIFTVKDENDNPLVGTPIKVNFSASGLQNDNELSNSYGQIVVHIDKINSASKTETLTLSLDINALTKSISSNLIKSIVRKIKPQLFDYKVNISLPSIKIETTSADANSEYEIEKYIKEVFGQVLENQFKIVENTCDFNIRISSEIRLQNTVEVKATVTSNIVINNSLGDVLYQKRIEKIGISNTESQAIELAKIEIEKTIKRMVKGEILKAVF